MKKIKWAATLVFSLFISTAFCQDKVVGIISSINVYFPNSHMESDNKKFDLNVQGVIVAIPMCDVNIAAVGEHGFQFTAKTDKDLITRGSDQTKSVTLTLVHSPSTRLVELLNRLQRGVCEK